MATNGDDVQSDIAKEKSIEISGSFYEKNLAWLNHRWARPKPGSIEAFRQPSDDQLAIWNFMLHPREIMGEAVIADNLDYLKEHSEAFFRNQEYWLIIASFCGAKKITDFLLTQSGQNYTPQILSYVAASINETWALEIARQMAVAGKEMPKSIVRFADDDTIDKIEVIFNEYKPKPTVRPRF